MGVDVDLFIKKIPHVVKELIVCEAFDNRRSINQEAIALLEEALVHRVGAAGSKRKRMESLLSDHFDAQQGLPPKHDPQSEPGALPLPAAAARPLATSDAPRV
jgi:hypothetical protein